MMLAFIHSFMYLLAYSLNQQLYTGVTQFSTLMEALKSL